MSRGFVCQTKTVNSCGHIPQHFAGQDKFSFPESQSMKVLSVAAF